MSSFQRSDNAYECDQSSAPVVKENGQKISQFTFQFKDDHTLRNHMLISA
jgi:hypothetical protein